MLLRACDALMRPQINDFIFLQALRMGRSEFVRGASAAARSVQSAVGAAIAHDGDEEALDGLLSAGALAPAPQPARLDEEEVRRLVSALTGRAPAPKDGSLRAHMQRVLAVR